MYFIGNKTRERILGSSKDNGGTPLCNSAASACSQVVGRDDILGNSGSPDTAIACHTVVEAEKNNVMPKVLRFTHNDKSIEPRNGSCNGWIHRVEFTPEMEEKLKRADDTVLGDVVYPSCLGVDEVALPVTIKWTSRYSSVLDEKVKKEAEDTEE